MRYDGADAMLVGLTASISSEQLLVVKSPTLIYCIRPNSPKPIQRCNEAAFDRVSENVLNITFCCPIALTRNEL